MTTVQSRACCFRRDDTALSKAVWEITFTCPLKCPDCFQERSGHRNTVSGENRWRITANVRAFLGHMRPRNVIIPGGEPLIRGDDLFERIDIGHTHSEYW
jgi:MoaA/NifB/PqqE/SkfB family radical SAM enzyme